MIWVINANSAVCRIYSYHKKPANLILLKEIKHSENKLKKSDYFTSDKPGHYKALGEARGAYSQQSDPKEVAIDHFSREIAKELNHERKVNMYEKLILIVLPHMDGLLNKHLDQHSRDLVTHTFQKDLLHLPERELLDFLQTNTKYPG